MPGAYCKFCTLRCFVLRLIPGGPLKGQSRHLATCAAGMAFDLEASGYTHETAINATADPEAAARVHAEVKAAAVVRAVAEYVAGALSYPLPELDATTTRMLGELGIDRTATVTETETALLAALGLAPSCNCVISGFDLLPASCRLHGVPCEECGGVESCTPECGETAATATADFDLAPGSSKPCNSPASHGFCGYNPPSVACDDPEHHGGLLCSGCGEPAGPGSVPIENGGVICKSCAAEDRARHDVDCGCGLGSAQCAAAEDGDFGG